MGGKRLTPLGDIGAQPREWRAGEVSGEVGAEEVEVVGPRWEEDAMKKGCCAWGRARVGEKKCGAPVAAAAAEAAAAADDVEEEALAVAGVASVAEKGEETPPSLATPPPLAALAARAEDRRDSRGTSAEVSSTP